MLEECLRSGERLWPNPPQFLNTIAEGIKLQQLGVNTFNIVKELAEKEVFEMVSICFLNHRVVAYFPTTRPWLTKWNGYLMLEL